MQLWSDDELRLMLLGNLYRTRHTARDRRGASLDADKLDPVTGLPKSANDLAHNAQAVYGIDIALKMPVVPSSWAEAHLGLNFTPKKNWTEEEGWAHAELTFRIKRVLNRMATEGLFNERPDSLFDGQPMALGQDGMTVMGQFTWKGLQEAEKVIPGTKYEKGAVSLLADAPDEIKNAAPQWAQDALRQEGRA